MCGIGGIKRMGERPIAPWQVDMLACSLEHRGNDATGLVVAFKDGSIEIFKDHEPAWRFLSQKPTQEWIRKQLAREDAQTVLVHTRKMTKGSQWRNENNHPMFHERKPGCAVVHNGMISNDDQLFRELELERFAETDSDILRAIIDKYGMDRGLIGRSGKLSRVNGSVAAAVVHLDNPGKVLLLRSNNPLYVASNGEHLCWASTKKSCYLTLKRWIDRHGIEMAVNDDKLAFVSMPNNTGWFLGDKLEWHEQFEASSFQRQVQYNVHTPEWHRKREAQKRADEAFKRTQAEEESKRKSKPIQIETTRPRETPNPNPTQRARERRRPDFVVCPGGCASILDLREWPIEKPLHRLKCPSCQVNLEKAKPCQEDGESLVN